VRASFLRFKNHHHEEMTHRMSDGFHFFFTGSSSIIHPVNADDPLDASLS
jgi:hypothetical protein